MVLSARLQLRQSQTLTMTPQLLQSIRLLQFTNVELQHFIEEEIEKNPLLERPDPDPVFQWKSAAGGMGGGRLDGGSFDVDQLAASPVTLADHVREQIIFSFDDARELLIAQELAGALDEAGYMRAEVAEMAQRLGCDKAAVLSVLAICQRFDPPGLFARDLGECLALQLVARDRFDPAMQAMIGRLDLVVRRDFVQLRRLCGVDDDDLLDMMAEIRRLEPRPGAAFAANVAAIIVPDIIVNHAGDGGWTVELNVETLPRVLVNQTYFTHVSKHAANQAERDFLGQCLQDANWLMRSLDQRARTILAVAREIVRQQDAFLLHGVHFLRPLILKEVAEVTNMHESTVSRAIANKYIMTPRGTFELRHFFSVAIAAVAGGDAHSSTAVRERIRKLIEDEASNAVLSDDAIVDILRKNGVDIARRTVAKYRETMDIPSSVQRRREKRARAAIHN